MFLKKAAWFTGILFVLMAILSVVLAYLEPGSTDPGELGRAVGRKIFLLLIATCAIYYGAKRAGWILKPRA